jgi:hypothetical protein
LGTLIGYGLGIGKLVETLTGFKTKLGWLITTPTGLEVGTPLKTLTGFKTKLGWPMTMPTGLEVGTPLEMLTGLKMPIGIDGAANDTVAGDTSNVLGGSAAGSLVGGGDETACKFTISLLCSDVDIASSWFVCISELLIRATGCTEILVDAVPNRDLCSESSRAAAAGVSSGNWRADINKLFTNKVKIFIEASDYFLAEEDQEWDGQNSPVVPGAAW